MSGCSGNCSSCGESCSDRKQESLLAEPNKNSQVKKVIASAAERTGKGAVKRADNGGDGYGGDGGKDRCTNPPK